MLIIASSVMGKPIITDNTGEIVGKVADIIVSPETGQIVGFLSKLFLQNPLVVPEQDVLEVTKNKVIITDQRALVTPETIPQIRNILQKKIKIINAKAVTLSGKKLGQVEDFVIETNSASVVSFYIKGGWFLPNRILSADNVVKIEKDKIIFENKILEAPGASESVII